MSKEEELIENGRLRQGIEGVIKDLEGKFEWTKADVTVMLERILKGGWLGPKFGFCPYCQKRRHTVPAMLLVEHQNKGQLCDGSSCLPGEEEDEVELSRMLEPEQTVGKTIIAVTRKPDETSPKNRPEEVLTFHFSDGTDCGIFTEVEEE